MGILDKIGLGKKKDEALSKKPVNKDKKPEKKNESFADLSAKVDAQDKKVDEPKLPSKDPEKKSVAPSGTVSAQNYGILIKPLLSEKITDLASRGKYAFAVRRSSNKTQVKKAIEEFYGVNVEQVNIINVKGKLRRYGKSIGRTNDWKKAVATLKSGEKIPGFVEAVGS